MTDTADKRDDANKTIDAWMAELFAVLENIEACKGSVGLIMTEKSYGFVPMSFPELK